MINGLRNYHALADNRAIAWKFSPYISRNKWKNASAYLDCLWRAGFLYLYDGDLFKQEMMAKHV